jgi:hypothetical protein
VGAARRGFESEKSMPEVKVSKTVTTTTRKSVCIEASDLEQLLIEYFDLPPNTEVSWSVDSYGEYLRHVTLTHQTMEVESDA